MSEQISTPVTRASPSIPDYELLRPVGRGAYGEVWLARNLTGSFVALKIVQRAAFDHDRPFEREFEGIQRFEPISRSDPSQVAILHVGRGDGFFYYVMELADDGAGSNQLSVIRNQSSDPRTKSLITDHCLLITSYIPKTLKRLLNDCGALPAQECLTIALSLTRALAHLHGHGLVHRDVKPSNVIFVGGVAKLADIGLVTSVDATRSFVGTEGYLPPEGAGTPQADLYSLGKVLYEMSTGCDRKEFPALPPDIATRLDRDALAELNAIVVSACQLDPRARYANAKELHADLALLQSGKSVKRQHLWTQSIKLGKKLALAAVLGGMLLISFLFAKSEFARRTARIKSSGDLFETSGTQNREAYNYYRLGRFHRRSDGWNAKTNAVACFEKAIQVDSKFARAYAGLAECYWSMAGEELPSRPTLEKQRDAVLKALALDDSLPEAHCILALWKRNFEWDWTGAEREFKRALELDSNNAMTHKHYAEFLSGMNRHDEAIREAQRAVAADPTWAATRDCHGWALYCAQKFERSIEVFRESAEQDPHYAITPFYLREVYSRMGRFDEAAAAHLQALEVVDAGRNPQSLQPVREANQQGGWLGIQRLNITRLLAVPPENRDGHLIASTYLRLGDKSAAMDWLERAADNRSSRICEIGGDPTFDPLRSEPRFHALLRKMGLEK